MLLIGFDKKCEEAQERSVVVSVGEWADARSLLGGFAYRAALPQRHPWYLPLLANRLWTRQRTVGGDDWSVSTNGFGDRGAAVTVHSQQHPSDSRREQHANQQVNMNVP